MNVYQVSSAVTKNIISRHQACILGKYDLDSSPHSISSFPALDDFTFGLLFFSLIKFEEIAHDLLSMHKAGLYCNANIFHVLADLTFTLHF